MNRGTCCFGAPRERKSVAKPERCAVVFGGLQGPIAYGQTTTSRGLRRVRNRARQGGWLRRGWALARQVHVAREVLVRRRQGLWVLRCDLRLGLGRCTLRQRQSDGLAQRLSRHAGPHRPRHLPGLAFRADDGVLSGRLLDRRSSPTPGLPAQSAQDRGGALSGCGVSAALRHGARILVVQGRRRVAAREELRRSDAPEPGHVRLFVGAHWTKPCPHRRPVPPAHGVRRSDRGLPHGDRAGRVRNRLALFGRSLRRRCGSAVQDNHEDPMRPARDLRHVHGEVEPGPPRQQRPHSPELARQHRRKESVRRPGGG